MKRALADDYNSSKVENLTRHAWKSTWESWKCPNPLLANPFTHPPFISGSFTCCTPSHLSLSPLDLAWWPVSLALWRHAGGAGDSRGCVPPFITSPASGEARPSNLYVWYFLLVLPSVVGRGEATIALYDRSWGVSAKTRLELSRE